MADKYLTFEEAAELLNVPVSTFRANLNIWRLVPVKIYPGKKGMRFIEREVLQVGIDAKRERDREVRERDRLKRKPLELAS
jgi:hypothetical protein